MKSWLVVIDTISEWSGKLFSFLAILVVASISYEVVARYIFDAPTIWAHETMVSFCAIWYMIGGAYVLRYRGHVSVDVVYNRLSSGSRRVLDLIGLSLFFVYAGVMLWTGAEVAWKSIKVLETSGSPWNPPVWPIRLAIPVGALLILLAGLAQFIRVLKLTNRKEPS